MRTAEDILNLYLQRQKADAAALSLMTEIRNVANLDIVIPLPEMDKAGEKPAVANLIAEGIDQISMRAASTFPHILFPALDGRKQTGRHSMEYADIRRKAVLSWWQQSRIKRIQRRRFRFLVAYGTAPIHIKPDFKHGIPKWEVRNPLQTYPNPTEFFDDDSPADVVFAYRKPYGWLKRAYPGQMALICDDNRTADTALFTLLEYADDHETVLVAVGSDEYHGYEDPYLAHTKAVELERVANRAGVCPVVTPKRVTLDRLFGQFNQVVGLYEAQAKLTALDLIATTKSVFPDIVLVGENGQPPKLLGETWADGMTGEINEVQDGNVQVIQLNPGYKTGEAIDRLERGIRIHGVAPQFGGENNTNIRTGRASEIAMSAQVDFRIQEYQEVAADAMVQEVQRAIAVAKGWFGDKPKSFYVQWKGTKGPVDYVPNKHFETDVCQVVYPMPGADVNGLMLGLGNRMALELISAQTGRELDPLIEDAELERDRVVGERLEKALLESLSMMAAQGMLPPADLAAIKRKVFAENIDLAEAVEQVQQEAQERQAQQVEATDPAAQPGLAVPGAGAEAGIAVPEPEPSMQNLSQILHSLRQPSSAAGGAPVPMTRGAAA